MLICRQSPKGSQTKEQLCDSRSNRDADRVVHQLELSEPSSPIRQLRPLAGYLLFETKSIA
jgi:hypothetical protein